MRSVALIYNPAAGIHRGRRASIVEDAARVFREAGVQAVAVPTESAESAGRQAQEAVDGGCDTIIACGGDGTVHDVLQSLVGGQASLGMIPMGTANALAADLGIPGSAVKAAKMLLTAAPTRVPVGRVFYRSLEGEERSRYFIVAAGVGADGLFFARIDSRMKERLGYAHYAIEAVRMAATHTFPLFTAAFTEVGSVTPRSEEVSQVLAVRIGNFGGLVQNLVPGAGLDNGMLRVVAFKTRSRMRYFKFMAAVWFRRHNYADTIELVKCSAVECRDIDGTVEPLYVEADGELLGRLPVRMDVVPDAVTVLVPSGRQD